VYAVSSLVGVFQTGRKPSLSLTTVSPIEFFWLDFFVGCYRACYLGLILWISGEDLQEAVVSMELSWLLGLLPQHSYSGTFSGCV